MSIEGIIVGGIAVAFTALVALPRWFISYSAINYKAQSAIGPYQVTIRESWPIQTHVKTWESLDGRAWFQSESGESASRRITKVCVMRLEMERRRETWSDIVSHYVGDHSEAKPLPTPEPIHAEPTFTRSAGGYRIIVDGKAYVSEETVVWYSEPGFVRVGQPLRGKLNEMWERHDLMSRLKSS